jgi:hypothetical protein
LEKKKELKKITNCKKTKTQEFLFFLNYFLCRYEKSPEFVWQKHRDQLQNHPGENKNKKKLTIIPNFLLPKFGNTTR